MWYKRYGWPKNPFEVKCSKEVIGLEKEKQKLLDYVNSGDACIILGDSGVGKTSLMKWLEKSLLRYKMNYINSEEMNEYYSLKKHVKKGWVRKSVLLLDEAHLCDEDIRKEIKLLWDANVVKSVVIAQMPSNLNEYSESLRKRIGPRVVKLGRLDLEKAKALIDFRTKGNNPFDDKSLKLLVEEAEYNPRKLLENCELVCMELKSQELNEDNIKRVLQKKEIVELEDLEKPKEVELPSNLTPIDSELLKGFAPMQKKIINILYENNRTIYQIAQVLNSSEGSVGKQVSMLTESGVVYIANPRRPKVYGLSENFKKELV